MFYLLKFTWNFVSKKHLQASSGLTGPLECYSRLLAFGTEQQPRKADEKPPIGLEKIRIQTSGSLQVSQSPAPQSKPSPTKLKAKKLKKLNRLHWSRLIFILAQRSPTHADPKLHLPLRVIGLKALAKTIKALPQN